MSLTQKKSDLVSSLGLFTTINSSLNIGDIQKKANTSINFANSSSKDPVMFCVNLLSILLGKEVLKGQLKVLLYKLLPDINVLLKSSLVTLLNSNNSNTSLPSQFTNSGYDIPVKLFDLMNTIKNSVPQVNTLNQAISDAIRIPGSNIIFQGLQLTFNPSTQMMNLKGINNSDITTFNNSILNNTSFINTNTIISEILDYIFGTTLKTNNLSKKDINNELVGNKIIENAVEDTENDTFYTLTSSQISQIENKTENIQNQSTLIDLDCGNLNFMMDQETLNEIVNSTDPIDALDDKLNNVTADLPVQANDDIKQGALRNVAKTNNNNKSINNNSAVKDDIYKNMFRAITVIIIKNTTLSPQIVLLQILNSYFNNTSTNTNSITDYTNSQKKLMRCITEVVKDKVSEELYNTVKKEVVKLTKPVLLKITQELLESYTKTITSLVSK